MANEPKKTKFMVRLTAEALVRGSVTIETEDINSVRRLVTENLGEIEWKYDGVAEGSERIESIGTDM